MAAFGGPTILGALCLYSIGDKHPWLALGLYSSGLVGSYMSVSRWLLGRLKTASQSTSRIAAGDYEHRIPKLGALELDRLADNINDLAAQMTERLEQTEQEGNQTRSLLDSIPEPVLAYNTEDELTYLNPAARHTLRVENQEAIGRQLAASWHGLMANREGQAPPAFSAEDPAKKLFRLASSLPEGNGEIRLGQKRVYWVTVIPYRESERKGKVLVLRDLTDLRRLEEVRTLFLGAVSHELRTPLTIIKGFAVTLNDHPAVTGDASLAKPLERIDQEADRLTRLVNDLLDLTRLQSQRLSIELQAVDPGPLIEETLALLLPLAERNDVQIQHQHQIAGNLVTVKADRDRLKQVLINLVDNAIKFSPGQSYVRVRSLLEDSVWTLVVEDSGPGVPANELQHLFEHFFRGRQIRKVTGSGLGLAIVKEIVELHGGQISAECDGYRPDPQEARPEGSVSGLRVIVRIPTNPSKP